MSLHRQGPASQHAKADMNPRGTHGTAPSRFRRFIDYLLSRATTSCHSVALSRLLPPFARCLSCHLLLYFAPAFFVSIPLIHIPANSIFLLGPGLDLPRNPSHPSRFP